MKRMRINRKKRNVGKVLTGMLVGSVLGATVGWLTAPLSGQEMRDRITGAVGSGSRRSVRGSRDAIQERVKTAEGNVESRARALASEVNEKAEEIKKTTGRRRKADSF